LQNSWFNPGFCRFANEGFKGIDRVNPPHSATPELLQLLTPSSTIACRGIRIE
jgi:hypothetical protein